MGLLTLNCAQRMINQAIGKAQKEYGRPIIISVCDAHGFHVAFARMEGAPIRSIQISISKAYSSIRMGSSTEAFLARLRKDDIDICHFCDPLLTALPGGTLLKDTDGKIQGAVGVSGLAPKEDQCVADYVAELFLADEVSLV